jgi:hypothetical protein
MAKFKKGDRVRNLEDNGLVRKGAIGTVDENENSIPWVIWDDPSMIKSRHDRRWAQIEEELELINEGQTNGKV